MSGRRLFDGTVHVHYGQVYIWSGTAGADLDEAFAGQENGLCGAASPGSLFLVTGLHTGRVGLVIEAHETEPELDDTWEDVVEVSFTVDSPEVALVEWGCAGGVPLDLGRGVWRVRYQARGADAAHVADTVLEDEPVIDRYRLDLWPAPAAADRVVKQTSETAGHRHRPARARSRRSSRESGGPGSGGREGRTLAPWLEWNRAWWDERVPIHTSSAFYDLEGFLAEPSASTLRHFEVGELGDVAGRRLVHLQCHFGLDTLSWARRGAIVTGLDFSPAAIEAARSAASLAGLDARFALGDVHDAVRLLGAAAFDVVYTGFGALTWLPDLDRWAAVVVALLRPGGRLLLAEFHPFTSAIDDDLVARRSYAPGTPVDMDEPGTYVDADAATRHNRARRWDHGLGRIVTALAAAGLTIERLREHDETPDPGDRRNLVFDPRRGTWRHPADRPVLPLTYTLTARRPEA
jgi:SAM-dependent methyltransferase